MKATEVHPSKTYTPGPPATYRGGPSLRDKHQQAADTAYVKGAETPSPALIPVSTPHEIRTARRVLRA